MEQLLSTIPAWVTTLALVIGGIFVVIGITDKKAKDRKSEEETLQEKIKKLYQEESGIQDEKIKEQAEKLKALGERLIVVETENTLMKELLKGTDVTTVAYRARVEATLTLVDKLSEIITLNGKKTDAILVLAEKTNENIEKLIDVLASKQITS